ncbi:hypothetical protein BZB76_0271 [Actinomadura pelletieri DSM 43383]|uniref:Uncharacterized protein n=1 Tax=Actinomadura pelletieri DSM 43383 TaxID=1120940 RepID=A0A495QXQ1_9ACTN|nr:hypothetical protein BZB76_0271 [Actinomadura pelletieri DSM 43383]
MKRLLVTVMATGIVMVGAASVAASASAEEAVGTDSVRITSEGTDSVRITNRDW